MNRNMVTAIILSIIILVGYQYFFMPTKQEQNPSSQPQDQKEHTDSQTSNKITAPVLNYLTVDNPVPEKEIAVENNLYKTIFSSKGATLKSIQLKKYFDSKGNPIIFKSDPSVPAMSSGVDEKFQFATVDFFTSDSDIKFLNNKDNVFLIFEYNSGDIFIRRTYTFYQDKYAFELKEEIKGIDSYFLTNGKNFGIFKRDSSFHSGPVLLQETTRIEFKSGDLEYPKIFKDNIKWIAEQDKYFFSAIIPKSQIQEAKVWKEKNEDYLIALKLNSGTNNFLIYTGPKEYEGLSQYHVGLEHIIDFGFFSIIARPLFWLLKWLYDLCGNYGFAIIVLTILTRIPFIPLINKSQDSMKKLSDIQPKMAEIRTKYKKDPKQMQQEMMLLYKKHKVNPMGGCLPILLQIPVFLALYSILGTAIELRGAPFIFWVTDLSVKDPYYILPIIMGITTFIQQKITPSTMDPKQQKIMLFMPIIFTFIFLNFASGLVLYWLINNILGIGQQFFINTKQKKQVMAV